ncbi:amidophosphoribosyltransferase [Pokkaliibacter sp. MBI-7]|uniref:Amidophosphoribosyltransferase n=1 Tax=Proteobacteria bacterium 228 TaxID=2083153 RepID=A0A2S5KR33_9PROT|nr:MULTISPECIES: amidophosphoribosyltransferase [Pokkaliibacter]MDH2435100.1 amidophosphoribosyltransferase [Pokkaliibacter sp. MBI-7]PPC77228.1 amidophosphoribosyltransferase [Pokkaliibacter plantistimulans]
MCGIVGIVANSHVNQEIFDALTVLQHRGQDAAGMVTSQNGRFFLRKDNGQVRDVFRTRHMKQLVGNIGIGHVRYPTAGSSSSAEAQPFYVNSPYGIALAHNGNLTNTEELAADLFREDLRHLNTSSDSEVLLNILAHELQILHKLKLTPEDLFSAMGQVYKRVRGAYAVVAMITGYGILAFRDPFGIRPLCIGVRETAGKPEYMVASESCALIGGGYKLLRDVKPGEAIFLSEDAQLFSQVCAEHTEYRPCIFEHVYLARPDSIIDGISVYKARLRMGEFLADKVLRERPEHDIDVVIPIPDTSRTAAMQMALKLGVKMREGFVKNRYIGRTFIMPGQKIREKSVRQKLSPIELEFRDRVVMLVDDSIVRGTTSRQIIEMARECGAKKVYIASAAPAIRYPNVYGIDMPAVKELVGHGRTDEEVAEYIGADWLVYQDLGDLIESTAGADTPATQFDCSVFDGDYVTGDVDEQYFAKLEAARNDGAKFDEELGDNETADMLKRLS